MPSEPHRETQGATAGDAAVECKQKVDGRSVAHWRRGARAVFLFVLLLGGSGWLFVTELKGRAAERVTAEREAAEREAAEREAAEREAAAREAAALEIAARAEGERLAKIAAEKAQREAEAAAAAKAAEERRALAAAERERWLVARTGEFVGESNRFRCNITSRKPAGSSDDSLWFRIVRSDERSSTYVFTDEITGNLRRVGPESNLFQGVLPREQKTYSPTLGHLRDSDRFAEVAVRISIVPSDATAYWYAAGETEFSVRGLLGSCSARRE